MCKIPKHKKTDSSLSRRDFLKLASSAAASSVLMSYGTSFAKSSRILNRPASAKQPNILFIFTDQERYIKQWPNGLLLSGHDRLKQKGVTFHNHYSPAVMCTSSRAVLLTGLQTADNGMFENADMPYVKPMSTDVPTIGHMLRKAGYYTAYKGKWHLNHDFDTREPSRLFTKDMDSYGFSDFALPVDGLAHALGGYKNDHMITGSAVSWLRDKGRSLSNEGKPWSLFVSLVNPHDIMYFNTDLPDENVQDTGKLMMHAARTPDHPLYRKNWYAPLPHNLHQPMNAPGRPTAHGEFDRAWGYTLGSIPPEDARWNRFNDFYFNSLRSVDQQLVRLLDELDAQNLSENTIVMFTSDHGEMGGAHGLRGKGPFAYQEAIHIPLIVSHPDVKGGQDCVSLTSHIDIVPSILAMCGIDSSKSGELAKRELPGNDFTTVFNRPGSSDVHAVRESILFTYSGLATNDSNLIHIVAEAKAAGKDPKAAVKSAGYKPDFKKRGSLRTMFDGRYKFTRYFSPVDRNQPKNLDELYRWNDVELYDLKKDQTEMTNLAAPRDSNPELVQKMSEKLETIIKAEFGKDDGREMPQVEGISWDIDSIDL